MSLAHYQLLKTKDAAVPAEEGYRMAPDEDPPTEVWRKYGLPIFILVAAATLGFLCGTHYQAHPAMEVVPQKSKHQPLGTAFSCRNPRRQTWLFDPHQNLNLTEGRTATVSDNIVFHIETYPPPKDDSLAFLDTSSNETRRALERYARVTIDHGGLSAPVTRDYVVGPLPTSPKSTTIRRLTEIYHQEDIPFNARGLLDVMDVLGPLGTAVAPMSDAVKDLFGGTVGGDPTSDTFIGTPSGGWSFNGSFRRIWFSWKINAPGSWVQPVDFYNYLDISGSDPSEWKILKVVYHNQTFNSVSGFLEAYNNGTLVRFPPPDLQDTTWASRKRTGTPRDLDHLPGPRSVSFAGPRFRLNREQGYVSWLGWGMYLSFDRDMGLSLWDIRFRGERIIYQLQPQDCLVQYSGHDPVQSVTSWLDRFFGMGLLTRSLLPNYDCPQEAVYLPATLYHPVLGVMKTERALCVFEMDMGKPLTRHAGDWPGETGAVKGYVLTVRSIASLGNYDYLFDYIFHLDGTVEVKVSASGYLQGGFWNPEQEGYGSRIHPQSMGNVHDHVINFKVDLDIAGRNNTFRRASTKVERVRMPWLDDDDYHSDSPGQREVLQQRIEYTHINSEDDARVRHSLNYKDVYAIVNRDEKNAWGSERGYTIHPGLSPVHNAIEKSQRLLNNANWASHHLAVSLRKDNEPSSSSMWNLHLPAAPPVDFDKFFDGEDIEQKDLVLWINVGTHHQPVAEDSPNTKTNVASLSFFLTPVNYFDSDPSMELLNAIVVNPAEDGPPAYTFDDNGVEQHFHCVPDAPAPFTYGD